MMMVVMMVMMRMVVMMTTKTKMMTTNSFHFRRPSRRKKPGDKMASRYFLWKLVHVFLGRVAIVLGLANVSVGLFLAQSSRVIWIAWFAYLGLLLLCHAE